MAVPRYQACRGLYLHGLPQEHLEATLREYAQLGGRTRRVRFGCSESIEGWQVLAPLGEVSLETLFELAVFLLGGEEEDFDLDRLAQESEIPDDAVVVVQVIPEEPARSFYATFEANDDFEVLFSGRREDGKGIRVNVVEGSTQPTSSTMYATSLVDYLRGRGVPEFLLPQSNGIEFEAVKVYPIPVHVE